MVTQSQFFTPWFPRLADTARRLRDSAGLATVVAERGGLKSESTRYLRVGNSYDEGTGAGTAANGMAALVAAARGWVLTNIAVGGQTLADYVQSQYGSRVVNVGDNIAGTFGLNDLRYYGPGTTKRMQYLSNFRASMAYLAIPEKYKVHAAVNSSGFTDYNPAVRYLPNAAAWNGAGAVFRGNTAATRALVTTSNGASLSAPVTGDTVLIWYGQSSGTAGRIIPIIDGRAFSSGAVGTDSMADAPSSSGQWMLNCLIVTGLTNGPHSVTIQSDSANATVVLAWAGINSLDFSGANIYAVGIPYLRPAHWNLAPAFNGSAQATTDGQSINFYELGSACEWNRGMQDVCQELKQLGLNTNFVDVSSISFQGVAGSDLHPEPLQHWQYARAELAVMMSLAL